MSAKSSPTFGASMPSDREIVFTRIFDAPRELVWMALDRLAAYVAKA